MKTGASANKNVTLDAAPDERRKLSTQRTLTRSPAFVISRRRATAFFHSPPLPSALIVALKLTVSASRGSPPSSTWPARNCANSSRAVFHSATSAQLQVIVGKTKEKQRATLTGVLTASQSRTFAILLSMSIFRVSTSSVKPVLPSGRAGPTLPRQSAGRQSFSTEPTSNTQ